MCRFQRHGHEIKCVWGVTAHMRKNFPQNEGHCCEVVCI